MITTILFDLDGVLINGKRFSTHLEEDYGISVQQTAPFFTNEFQQCLIGKADLKETISKHLNEWGWKETVDNLLKYWFEVDNALDTELINYIQSLRSNGLKCIIATNQERYRAEYISKNMNFANTFDEVYSSVYLCTKKPDQTFFAKVLEKLNISNKNEVLFWDDSTANVEAASSFGIQAEQYKNFADFKKMMLGYRAQF